MLQLIQYRKALHSGMSPILISVPDLALDCPQVLTLGFIDRPANRVILSYDFCASDGYIRMSQARV